MTPFPPPASVGAQAKAVLSLPAQRHDYPARDDTDGWLAHIAANDAGVFQVMPPVPDTVVLTELRIGEATVYIHRPTAVPEGGPVYLDLHPGALIQLGGAACRLLGGHNAAGLGLEVWSVDYRMPPLHPYPAGLDDALEVYRALVEERGAERVVVGGVSAGGNLAAALLLRARSESLPMPAAVFLGTPEVDLTESGDTFVVLAEADNTLAGLREVNKLYADGQDLTDPYLSPLFAEDVSFFPPTLLSSGTRDLFLSNTVRMHRKLRQSGVAAQLHVFEAMPHVGFGPGSPEDADLRNELREFLRTHLARA